MKHFKTVMAYCLALGMVIALWPVMASAEEYVPPHPSTYIISKDKFMAAKAPLDDPRPMLTTIGPYQTLPKELIQHLTYDVEAMQKRWAEAVGFNSTDLVGKIAPEIKPGKYTYQDLEKYPGFKELLWPSTYERMRPGGPPFAGAIPTFEVVPTQQYYYALPYAQATLQNEGKTKLDKDGYLISGTWEGGMPFPKPSGEHKGIQLMYNWEKRGLGWNGNFFHYGQGRGYTKNLRQDSSSDLDVKMCQLRGRVLMPPYGFLDERAKLRGEMKAMGMVYTAPRDLVGLTYQALYFEPYDATDQIMMYIPSLRRIRKMTATDTQDPFAGADFIYDDGEGFIQKLSPVRYPYKYKVLEEREFLVNARTYDGSEYVESKGLSCVNVKLERRPCYVLEMTQQDPTYVYGKRIMLIDKETFLLLEGSNYDQKGRLYRRGAISYSFWPEMGMWSWSGGFVWGWDYIDTHSTLQLTWQVPAFWQRRDIAMKGMLEKAK